AEAKTQLANEPSAPGDLVEKVDAAAAELDRFRDFLVLIDRAHQAETTTIPEPTFLTHGAESSSVPPALNARVDRTTVDRQPAAATPFILTALDSYGILKRDDLSAILNAG